ncbi:hypothetical protein QCE58_29950 [Caballeronia sp. LZ028]|nr:hypothetical protein [Caballeronia sp. LZ028]
MHVKHEDAAEARAQIAIELPGEQQFQTGSAADFHSWIYIINIIGVFDVGAT